MRWALTSPDGLGDFLLRLPWLVEMERAGWELALAGRAPTLELALLAGLRFEPVEMRLSAYSKDARKRRDPFRRERAGLAGRDLVFFGPSQPTFFEEELAARMPGARFGGFVLEEEFWPGEGLQDPVELSARYSLKVPVRNEDAEPERNQRAASALLGRDVRLEGFRFSPGIENSLPGPPLPDEYLAVCAGRRVGDYFPGWGTARWIEELKAIEDGRRFVFVGSAGEADAHREIVAGLARPGDHLDLTGTTVRLAELLGVLRAASAYVGKDCGTMHLASALGKPVLAVFGGGHWRRFLPVSSKAVVLSAAVPCRGCDWRCHLPSPACVVALPQGILVRGWETLGDLPPGGLAVLEDADSSVPAVPAPDYPRRVHAERRAALRRERRAALEAGPFAHLLRLWRG